MKPRTLSPSGKHQIPIWPREVWGCSSLYHSFSNLREDPSLDLDTTAVSRAINNHAQIGCSHSPRAEDAPCLALSLTARSPGVSSPQSQGPPLQTLFPTLKTTYFLDTCQGKCLLQMGKAYPSHKSMFLLTGPRGIMTIMTQQVLPSIRAFSLQ